MTIELTCRDCGATFSPNRADLVRGPSVYRTLPSVPSAGNPGPAARRNKHLRAMRTGAARNPNHVHWLSDRRIRTVRYVLRIQGIPEPDPPARFGRDCGQPGEEPETVRRSYDCRHR